MNANHLNMFLFNTKCDVPSHLQNYPITCKGGYKGYGSNLNSRSSCYDRCILPFVVDKVESIEHVTDNGDEEGMENNKGSYGASMHRST